MTRTKALLRVRRSRPTQQIAADPGDLLPAQPDRGRVGGVVAEPLPPQTRACAIDALGSSPDRFAQGALP